MQFNYEKIKCVSAILLINVIINVIFLSVYAEELPTFAVVETQSKEVDSKKVTDVVAEANFNFESKAQILMEASTGQVIYESNSDEKLLPASVTKIMTLLITMETIDAGKISYDDKVTCSENASKMGGSQIWFKPGEELTVDEALKCICVVSANDVSVAMAEMIGGNEDNFVKMMNDKAHELGMKNTNFMNAHGIDEENHYTSARDIAIMSRELITKHPDILRYTSVWMDSIRNGTFNLSNTNKLIRYYEGANGLKTGSTSQALFNLSATATRNNMTLIAVVMTAPTGDIRNEETKQLLNYGFTNFEVQELSKKGELAKEITINKFIEGKVAIKLKEDVSLLNEKGKKQEITKETKINDGLIAPIVKNTTVGKVIYKNKEGEIVKESELVNDVNIPKSNVYKYIVKALKIYSLM